MNLKEFEKLSESEKTEAWQKLSQEERDFLLNEKRTSRVEPVSTEPPIAPDRSSASPTANMSSIESSAKAPWQLTFILLLMLIGVGMPFWSMLRPPPKWEYKTVSVLAQTGKISAALGENYEKLADAVIPIEDEKLEALGREGWELVSTFLEFRTEHPNFGNGDYVTGLQPNVRPQRLVCIFKRPVSLLKP